MMNKLSQSARRICDRLALKIGTLPFFLVVAALIHLAFVPVIVLWILHSDDRAAGDRAMSVDLWSRSNDDKSNEDLSGMADDAMVAVPDNSDSPPSPTATKFLSSKGSSTGRETRKKGMGRRKIEQPPKNARVVPPTVSSTGQQKGKEGKSSEPSDGDVQTSALEAVFREAEPEPRKPLKLRPDNQTLSSAITGSGLADLGDLEEGNQTALNSRAFRHASFFSRVQKMVEQFWRPDHAMDRNDPEAKLIGKKDRVTTLLVVLKPNGQIHRLYTKRPSGASFLDREAINAIRKAAPFPNVPEGLVNETDGLVKFLFQFTVEFNQRPVVRVRKYE